MEKIEKLRWGFIGAGGIAKRALFPAISKSNVGEIYAVASRDKTKALTISPNGIVYTSYDELLADPKVEAVYISLPNSLHLPLAIKAMRAGKHVLCEKPLGMNAAEVEEAIAVSKETNRIFVEASWNRWHPRSQRIREIVASGELGKITHIRTCFTYDGLDQENIRLDPKLGGGILYDLGPYSTVAPLWAMDFADISDLDVQVIWHKGGTDETTRANFTIGGAKAETIASDNIQLTHWFIIEGTKGELRTGGNDSFNSHNNPSTLEITVDGKARIERFEACDPYQLMSDAFARVVRGGNDWLMPMDQSLKFAKLFDAIFAKMGRP
ncbi:MAG: Gfo/Idh/MocA family oxidoreductase [Actinomycetes bacterium]|jgi:predicted dehydrogenase